MDLRKDIYFYADLASFPTTGSLNVLYVDKLTGFIYIWNGTSYVASSAGGLKYSGLWDASTNNPAITSGVGSTGEYYVVGTAGNTNIDGESDWQVGDWIIFGGTIWQKIDNSDREGYSLIQEEGVSIAQESTIDFTGNGVSVSAGSGKTIVNIPGAAGTVLYYMNQTVAQAPYQEFSSIGTTASEQVVPATVAGGATTTIAEFQTPSGIPGSIVIPQGLWQFYLHFNATTAGQNWIIRPLVYKRDLGGIETLIFTPDPEVVTNMSTTTTMYLCDGVIPTTTLLTTDRIVVKIDMENTTGVSQTVNFRTEGSQHYSVAATTLNQAVPTGAVTDVTGTAPVVSSGGTTPAISIADAVADGTTKGAASFTTSDFNSSSGNISIDYTNGQESSASNKGFLTSADWTTFNGKVPSTRNITINGTTQDLSADRTWSVGTVTSAGITAGTGISLAGTNPITSSGSITVTNSAPDQVVALTAGAGIGVTGTYPNFTIDNTVTDINIYNSDGTLAGTRVVDLAGNLLTFSSSSDSAIQIGAPNSAVINLLRGSGFKAWAIVKDVDGAEDFRIDRHDSTGGFLSSPIKIYTSDGAVEFNGAYKFPTSDGLANEVLSTDGAGNLSWGTSADTNIYNTDGTLSADRTVAMNNNQLTFSGGPSANGTQINLSAAANRPKALNFTVGSALRWKQQVSGTEIGGDNGSQLAMLYYDDAGVAKGTAFSISRTNGAFRLNNAYSLPLSGGTTGQVLTNTSLGLTEFQSLPAEIQVAASDETTNLTTGTAKVTFRMPHAMTLTAVRASLSTAQTAGALLTVDINLNGISVLGTKLTFDNTEKTTVTAATPATIVTSALTNDGEITVDIDTVGTAGAKGLKITLIGTRA